MVFEEAAHPCSTTRSMTALSILFRSGTSPDGLEHWSREREELFGARQIAPVFGYYFSAGEITCDARLIILRSFTGNALIASP